MESSVLRGIVDAAATDPESARADLVESLRRSGGPLVEQRADGRAVVTFVVVGAGEQPHLRCALVPGLVASTRLQRIPALGDVWWVEFEARNDISTPYQFQHRPTPPFPIEDRAPNDNSSVLPWLVEVYEMSYADPFNPNRMYPEFYEAVDRQGSGTPPQDKWESVLTLPGAAPFPWHDEPAASGSTHEHQVSSAVLGNTRKITVWTPPGHDPSAGPYPVVVLFDGSSMLSDVFGAPRIFDNLVAGGHLEPFVAVLIDNPSETSRARELPCNADTTRFVADELLPTIGPTYGLSDDPAATVIGGFSYGGLAANWLAFDRPDRFGNVLSMSASMWWGKRPSDDTDSSLGRDGEPEWLTRQYAASDLLPIRFWVDVGSLETAAIKHADDVSQVTANRHFRDVLTAKGYRIVGYREQPGAHDYLCWRRTLPDGLIALLGKA